MHRANMIFSNQKKFHLSRYSRKSFSFLSPDKSNKSKEIQISKERSGENPL